MPGSERHAEVPRTAEAKLQQAQAVRGRVREHPRPRNSLQPWMDHRDREKWITP